MIIKELFFIRKDGVSLYKTYSDKDVYIHKIGTDEEYSIAIDVEDTPFRYEETDKKLEDYKLNHRYEDVNEVVPEEETNISNETTETTENIESSNKEITE